MFLSSHSTSGTLLDISRYIPFITSITIHISHRALRGTELEYFVWFFDPARSGTGIQNQAKHSVCLRQKVGI